MKVNRQVPLGAVQILYNAFRVGGGLSFCFNPLYGVLNNVIIGRGRLIFGHFCVI